MTHQAESKIKQKVQRGVSILQIVLHGHIPKSRGQTSSWGEQLPVQTEGFTHTTLSARSLLRQHKALGAMRKKWLNVEFPSLEIFNANRNPWNPSGWTCFVQGVQQGNILPTSAVPWSFNIPFKHNLFDQKTQSAIISVRLLKGKKKTLHPQISGKVQDSFGLCRCLNTWENILKTFIKIMHKPRRHMRPYRILIFSI